MTLDAAVLEECLAYATDILRQWSNGGDAGRLELLMRRTDAFLYSLDMEELRQRLRETGMVVNGD